MMNFAYVQPIILEPINDLKFDGNWPIDTPLVSFNRFMEEELVTTFSYENVFMITCTFKDVRVRRSKHAPGDERLLVELLQGDRSMWLRFRKPTLTVGWQNCYIIHSKM